MGLADKLAASGIKNAEKTKTLHYISTGYPPLDHALSARWRNGGLPSGRIVEMFGPPSAGKTAISTAAMVNVQQSGGLAVFQDHENSFDEGLGVAFGLNTDPDFWSYNKPDTFEQSVDQVEAILLAARAMHFSKGAYRPTGETPDIPIDKPIVVVFDSLASMVPQSTLLNNKGELKDASERNMNDNTALARATSAHFPRLALLAERTNTLMIFLNQVRTKLGVMYGDPTTTPGGGAPEYYSSVRIKLGRSMLVDPKDKSRKIGQRIGAESIKNKVSAPYQKAEWDFLFQDDGTGKFDVVGGTIDAMKSIGKIESAGAYLVWDGKKLYRSQLVELIENDPAERDKLFALLPE